MDQDQLKLLLRLVAENVQRTESSLDCRAFDIHMTLDIAVGIAAKVAPGPYQNELQRILIDTFVR